MALPFRQSSLHFGLRGSGRAALLEGEGEDSGAGAPAGDDERRGPPLAGGALVDVEAAYDDRLVFSWRRLLLHVGPGALMCIAYIDPGNLEADLQMGAGTGYQLGWVVLWSTVCGGVLQTLAARLGVATGAHLAQHCRRAYPRGARYALWLMAELAIVGSDVQEVIGTALAVLLLSGGAVPLWGGVVLAAGAAYGLLFLERWGVRYLEAFFEVLLAIMSLSFGALFFRAGIPYGEVARGLAVPRLSRGAIPTACGLLGAIIMPHNLFLHSALVHSRPLGGEACAGGAGEGEDAGAPPPPRSDAAKRESILYYSVEAFLALAVTLCINVFVASTFARGFWTPGEPAQDIGLANAGEYLGAAFGGGMAAIFGIGLLAAGQSSTMTGTYAGQFVMGGFLDLRVRASTRTLITRAVAICPTLLVALSAREDSTRLDALNQKINILQSVQLPFALIPLLLFTSDPAVMGREFVNSRALTATCWGIAAAVIAINCATAFEALAPLVHSTLALHVVFWAVASCYVGFLAYLILTPEGAQRLATSVSRNVSTLSFRRAPSNASLASTAGGRRQGASPPAQQQQPNGGSAGSLREPLLPAGGPGGSASAGTPGASP